MNRLEIEQKILQYSRQISDESLLEVLHYLEFLVCRVQCNCTEE